MSGCPCVRALAGITSFEEQLVDEVLLVRTGVGSGTELDTLSDFRMEPLRILRVLFRFRKMLLAPFRTVLGSNVRLAFLFVCVFVFWMCFLNAVHDSSFARYPCLVSFLGPHPESLWLLIGRKVCDVADLLSLSHDTFRNGVFFFCFELWAECHGLALFLFTYIVCVRSPTDCVVCNPECMILFCARLRSEANPKRDVADLLSLSHDTFRNGVFFLFWTLSGVSWLSIISVYVYCVCAFSYGLCCL